MTSCSGVRAENACFPLFASFSFHFFLFLSQQKKTVDILECFISLLNYLLRSLYNVCFSSSSSSFLSKTCIKQIKIFFLSFFSTLFFSLHSQFFLHRRKRKEKKDYSVIHAITPQYKSSTYITSTHIFIHFYFGYNRFSFCHFLQKYIYIKNTKDEKRN